MTSDESFGFGPKIGFKADFGIFPWLRNRGAVDWVAPLWPEDRFDPYTFKDYLYVPLKGGVSFGIEYSGNDSDLEQVLFLFEYSPSGR